MKFNENTFNVTKESLEELGIFPVKLSAYVEYFICFSIPIIIKAEGPK